MSEMSFNKGVFVRIQAKTTIHLGKLERNLYQGDIVEFDGTTLRVGSDQVLMPELKAGLKKGWLVLVEPSDYVEEPQQPKASVTDALAKKKMVVDQVYDEERSVADIGKKSATEQKKFPLKIEDQDDDMKSVAQVENKSGASVSGASSAMDNVSAQQGAEAVKIPLKTASKQKIVITDGNQISQEMAKLENMERPKVVVVEDQQAEESIPMKLSVDELSSVLNQSVEVVQLENPMADPKPVEQTQFEQDVQTVDALDVSSPTGAIVTGTDPSVVVLEGGIEWNKSKHWQHRVKLAVEKYGSDAETLAKIKAIETDGVVKAIEKALANNP